VISNTEEGGEGLKESELLVYSGRNRPDLGPAYRLFEALTGVKVKVERIYHQEVGARCCGMPARLRRTC
jgi:predicted ATP-grasp superfamily ATP-dependent carboligase